MFVWRLRNMLPTPSHLPDLYDIAASRSVSRITSRLVRRPTPRPPGPTSGRGRVLRLDGRPKQVLLTGNLALVPCMSGALDVVSLHDWSLVASVPLAGMAVDVAVDITTARCFVSVMVLDSSGPGAVAVIDTEGWSVEALVPVGCSRPKGLALRPGSRELWITTWRRGDVIVVDIDTLAVVGSVRCGDAPRGIAFDPDGKRAFVAGYYSRRIYEVDAVQRLLVRDHRLPGRFLTYLGTPRDVLTLDDRTWAVSNMGRGEVHLFRTTAKGALECVATAVVGGRAATLRRAGDGAIVVACHADSALWKINLETFAPVSRHEVGGRPYGVDATPCGTSAMAACFEEAAFVEVSLR